MGCSLLELRKEGKGGDAQRKKGFTLLNAPLLFRRRFEGEKRERRGGSFRIYIWPQIGRGVIH